MLTWGGTDHPPRNTVIMVDAVEQVSDSSHAAQRVGVVWTSIVHRHFDAQFPVASKRIIAATLRLAPYERLE